MSWHLFWDAPWLKLFDRRIEHIVDVESGHEHVKDLHRRSVALLVAAMARNAQ